MADFERQSFSSMASISSCLLWGKALICRQYNRAIFISSNIHVFNGLFAEQMRKSPDWLLFDAFNAVSSQTRSTNCHNGFKPAVSEKEYASSYLIREESTAENNEQNKKNLQQNLSQNEKRFNIRLCKSILAHSARNNRSIDTWKMSRFNRIETIFIQETIADELTKPLNSHSFQQILQGTWVRERSWRSQYAGKTIYKRIWNETEACRRSGWEYRNAFHILHNSSFFFCARSHSHIP